MGGGRHLVMEGNSLNLEMKGDASGREETRVIIEIGFKIMSDS
jgi:hypothetical protein